MIVYLASKADFLTHVSSNTIADRILTCVQTTLKHSIGASERQSWNNSMGFMYHVLTDAQIPDDAGIAIEFNIPRTTKRIDFVVTGLGENKQKVAIIVELKQWTEVECTEKDAIVETFLGGSVRETNHPSYQAWSYAALLEDFNEAVRREPIMLYPCAYLHNCISDVAINSPFYAEYTRKAPSFLKHDTLKLRDFVRSHVRYGDNGDAMYRIVNGRIAPSKNLADSLASLLKGNREFIMIDDQKIVFETALQLAKKSTENNKCVLIVEGGPGTGKSVVAINLLVELTKRQQIVQYVTKNAAPRAVFESKLTGQMRKSRISNLFTSSGAFTDTKPNTFDVLLVDEAHRLNAKSGMFQNIGENQIKELINSAKLSVFFIDEDQRVTFQDIGEKSEIRSWAKSSGAKVRELTLSSQFRCNGSDGYIAWLDNLLQIRETANTTLDGINYDFVVFDSPLALHNAIFEKNVESNRARTVAGYCWEWASKKKPSAMDINIPEHNFRARWNLADDGSLWIVKPESVNEIGCIHTCQGLELDYIGVIIGPDLVVRDGMVETIPEARAKADKSIKGYKALLKESPDIARARAAAIIKNTYRTLMTRGQKGRYVFATDPETNLYIQQWVKAQAI